jgi:glycosyltransferase involved in cell wall biosynthesis
MKILYIHTLYAPHYKGGAEYSLQIIVEAMHKKGHEVLVLATSDKKGLHQETVNGIKVYRAGIKNRYWQYNNYSHSKISKLLWHIQDIYNQGMADYLENILSVEKPDIISCHIIGGWSIAVWDVIYRTKIPVVQVLHDFYLLCARTTMLNKNNIQCNKRCLKCRMMRYLHKKKSKRINAVVGISQYIIGRVLNTGYFKDSITRIIYNARIISNSNRIHQQISTSNIVFGYIGTLAPNKGVQWLIEQFNKISSNSILLKIAGEGNFSYTNLLKNISANDTRISFTGYVKSEDFYPQIDVLIVPSIWNEPLGMVAIEACAHHIPVITSATGGLKEIITDGHNGLYCDISIPDSLSDAMRKIINDRNLLYELQKNARKSVRSFLDIDRLTSEYEDVYKRVIASKIL